MAERINLSGLMVDERLARFVEDRALPGTGVSQDAFWAGFSGVVRDLSPRNRVLLARREVFQKQIDEWHGLRRGKPHDHYAYRTFLEEIGYLLPEGKEFAIDTANVDPEIATIPGPQLVVPVTNARYALNAANARWGSLYDCLYGTDAMGSWPPKGRYESGNAARGIARARGFACEACPTERARHAEWRGYFVTVVQLRID